MNTASMPLNRINRGLIKRRSYPNSTGSYQALLETLKFPKPGARFLRSFIAEEWDSTNLDRRLSDPAAFIAGCRDSGTGGSTMPHLPLRNIALCRRTMGLEKPMEEIAFTAPWVPRKHEIPGAGKSTDPSPLFWFSQFH